MDLRQIECFLAVADEGHFGRAAARLHLSQPTVSQAVQRLETEIGGRLLDRSTRHVRLTPVGQVFEQQIRRAYEHVDDAFQAARQLTTHDPGRLRVGCDPVSQDAVLSAIPIMRRRNPAVTVEVEHRLVTDQLSELRRRTIDVAVSWFVDREDDMVHSPLGSTQFVAAVAPSRDIRPGEEWTMARLAEEPLVAWERSRSPRVFDRFWSAMSDAGLTWSVTATGSTGEGLVAHVLSDRGVGVFLVLPPLLQSRVQCIPIIDAPTVEWSVAWPRLRSHAAAPAFLAALREAGYGQAVTP